VGCLERMGASRSPKAIMPSFRVKIGFTFTRTKRLAAAIGFYLISQRSFVISSSCFLLHPLIEHPTSICSMRDQSPYRRWIMG
jgi:hypothetical protein